MVTVTLLAGAASVALAACGGGSPQSAPKATVGPGPSSSMAGAPDASAEVLIAYRAMWADLVAAARTSDFQSPLLSHHASGDALTLFAQGLARDQLNGIVTRGEPVLQPQVASLSPTGDPTAATVLDCFDDTHWLEYNTTGGLAKNAPSGRRSTTAHLKEVDGNWKVIQLTIGATGTC